MAGPWFTVLENGSSWKKLDTITLSNGKKNLLGDVEIHVKFATPRNTL